MGSIQDRQRERRDQQLKEIQRQVKSGSLVIRKMTAKERAKFPPRPPRPAKKRSR
ncbi:MAG TPA: hypothetical protein VHE14_09190 [Solirubrobacteraceae bacterium]|nr:hypothetical protein [Solirubrobacteraceae bacterium]